jgi:hypothetical protein
LVAIWLEVTNVFLGDSKTNKKVALSFRCFISLFRLRLIVLWNVGGYIWLFSFCTRIPVFSFFLNVDTVYQIERCQPMRNSYRSFEDCKVLIQAQAWTVDTKMDVFGFQQSRISVSFIRGQSQKLEPSLHLSETCYETMVQRKLM